MSQVKRKQLNFHVSRSKKESEQNSSDLRSMLFDNRIASGWLSTKAAAKYLDISENALRIKVHRDQIKSYKFGGRLKFKIDDLDLSFNEKEIL